MNILDEHIVKSQRQLLSSWRVPYRHISSDFGRSGMDDEEIIPLLHKLRDPTFFTMDIDFYKPRLCHAGYCIVYLAVEEDEAALFIRRFLRHGAFKTEAKRMGALIRVSYLSLTVWRLHEEKPIELLWERTSR